MQNNKSIIILEPEEGFDYLGSIYLERSVFGVVVLVNVCNYVGDINFKLVLTDQEGFSHLENITSSCYMFKLTNSFSVGGDIAAIIYDNDKVILSGESATGQVDYKDYDCFDFNGYDIAESTVDEVNDNCYENITNINTLDEGAQLAKSWATETNQLHLFNEANEIIKKARAGGLFNFNNNGCGLNKDKEETNRPINNETESINAGQTLYAYHHPNGGVYNEKYNIYNKEDEIEMAAGNCNGGLNTGNYKAASGNNAETEKDDFGLKEYCNEPKTQTAYTGEYEGSVKFSDIIGDDFDMLYNMSLPFNVLNSYIENSDWRKLELSGSVYYLCKVNGGKDGGYFGIGVPVLKQNRFCGELGKNAEYISIWPYDDFGFLVLLQDARNGKAIKLNGNMC